MIEDRPAYEPASEIIVDKYGVEIDASHHDDLTADGR